MRLARVALLLAVVVLALAGCGGKSKKESSSAPTGPSGPTGQSGGASKPASTPSGQTVALAVRVAPSKPGGPATVSYAALIASRGGAKPAPVDQITFRAQSGFKLNADRFPTCSVGDLKAGRKSSCENAKVGDGSAQVISPKGEKLASKISTFNGGKHGGGTTLLYLVETPGYAPIAAAATVKKQSGEWGYAITYPPISKALPLAALQLRTFDKTAKSGGKTVHLIEAPPSCSGSWNFESRVSFRSGEKLTVPATTTCTP